MHDTSDIIVQIVGICVAVQNGTAVHAHRDELAELKAELNKRFDAIERRLKGLEEDDAES